MFVRYCGAAHRRLHPVAICGHLVRVRVRVSVRVRVRVRVRVCGHLVAICPDLVELRRELRRLRLQGLWVRVRVRVRHVDVAIWLTHSFSNSYSIRHAWLGLGIAIVGG